jgi:hypothetical protein
MFHGQLGRNLDDGHDTSLLTGRVFYPRADGGSKRQAHTSKRLRVPLYSGHTAADTITAEQSVIEGYAGLKIPQHGEAKRHEHLIAAKCAQR